MHVLYRFFDDGDRLLYVGRTTNPGARFKSHQNWQCWWSNVATIKLWHYENAEELATDERIAIETEHPAFNVTHNEGRVKLVRPIERHGKKLAITCPYCESTHWHYDLDVDCQFKLISPCRRGVYQIEATHGL